MFFFNLWYLWFIPLIAIPILLNIWKKQRIKEIDFPYFSLIQKSNVTNLTALHIMNILLLLLRMLLIAGLIFYMMRPILSGLSAAPTIIEHVPVVYIYDNSLSMSYAHNGTVLAKQARIQLIDAIKALPPDVPASLLFLNEHGSLEMVEAHENPERLLQALNGVSVQHYRFDLTMALHSADSFFRSLTDIPFKARKKIIVFTDNQQHNMRSADDTLELLPSIQLTIICPRDMQAGGVGWSAYTFPDRLLKPGDTGELSTQIKNFSDTPWDNLVVRFYVDDQLVEESSANLEANTVIEKSFYFEAGTVGFHRVRAELVASDFTLDNILYGVIPVYAVPRIVIVASPDESLFIHAAAMTYLPDANDGAVVVVPSYDKVPQLSEGDIVICASDGSSEMGTWIKNAVAHGIGVIAFASSEEQIDHDAVTSVEQANMQHPVLVPYADAGERPFESIRITQYQHDTFLPALQNRVSLLKTAEGIPFLEQVTLQSGTLFVFYTDAGEHESNFVRTDVYLPLIHRLFDYIAASNIGYPNYFNRIIGDTVSISDDAPFSVQWTMPGDIIYNRDSVFIDGKYEVGALPVSHEGYYSLKRDDDVSMQFAYTIPLGEGDFTPIDRKFLMQHIPDVSVAYVDMFTADSNGSLTQRRDIGIHLLIGCLVICLVELLVANKLS